MSAETDQHTNIEYARWIQKLDEADIRHQWEIDFIASNKEHMIFTNKQREVILNMVERYL